LKFAVDNHAGYALLSSTKRAVIGEASVVGYGTSKQGAEPVVAVLGYQQAKDVATGTRQWHGIIVPSTQAIINAPSMTDGEMQYEVSLIPSGANHHLWGPAFTESIEGFTRAEVLEVVTANIPHVVSWLANNSATAFLFAAAHQAVSTAKIHAVYTVSIAGVVADVTSTCTKAVTGVTITGPLAAGIMVCCFYEYAAS
jgi:hypothetical protein